MDPITDTSRGTGSHSSYHPRPGCSDYPRLRHRATVAAVSQAASDAVLGELPELCPALAENEPCSPLIECLYRPPLAEKMTMLLSPGCPAGAAPGEICAAQVPRPDHPAMLIQRALPGEKNQPRRVRASHMAGTGRNSAAAGRVQFSVGVRVPRAAITAFAEYRSAGAALRHSPRGDRAPASGTPSPAQVRLTGALSFPDTGRSRSRRTRCGDREGHGSGRR
jgi:hypothetical protein